ncbi:ferritin-like domain-containing protein [Polychytrium aggregatum]|uniref:ferritin-like domain-containing protein n=1 Tax=Polychytrium aggregatum TaxID=110093 RepID=UPI0022FEBE3F|nr:ferritin-like domain-containing protein [Polychytrium aggregatum]KAI9203349.1 ferritin-like domain-containing protein [Polychytrium aggregatum]
MRSLTLTSFAVASMWAFALAAPSQQRLPQADHILARRDYSAVPSVTTTTVAPSVITTTTSAAGFAATSTVSQSYNSNNNNNNNNNNGYDQKKKDEQKKIDDQKKKDEQKKIDDQMQKKKDDQKKNEQNKNQYGQNKKDDQNKNQNKNQYGQNKKGEDKKVNYVSKKIISSDQRQSADVFFPGFQHQANSGKNSADLFVLNFALTLEHLESAFNREGLSRFKNKDFERGGFSRYIRDEIKIIAFDESTHVTTLISVIESSFGKGKAVSPCRFNFGLRDVNNFLAIAQILERTGVQAYDGAIRFIENDDIKNAGAAIATVEGRHSSFLNILSHRHISDGPFDAPLGVRSVTSIAASFIESCPFEFPVQPFDVLEIRNIRVRINTEIEFRVSGYGASDFSSHFCAIVYGLSQKRVGVKVRNNSVFCDIPTDLRGFSSAFIFLVNADADVSVEDDSHVVAGPTSIDIIDSIY